MVEKYLRNANLFDRKYFYLNSCQGGRGFPTSISRACSIDSLNNVNEQFENYLECLKKYLEWLRA